MNLFSIADFKVFTVIVPILFFTATGSWGQNYVTPETVTTLSDEVMETSGLLNTGDAIWTHNDSGDDALIYQVDPETGDVVRTVAITNAENVDWEDITRDDTYIYIGDIGNNDGSRTDLKIYRVLLSDLEISDEVEAETIHYHYSDQVSFEPSYHNTNFDCEAMLHYQGSLYLFTKNWIDFKTNCYVLPDIPGDHEALPFSSFDAGCLVTGATMVPDCGAMVFIGYTSSGGSFTWVFDEFEGDDFFGGQNTKLIWTILSQIEGVCDAGSNAIYISSEAFSSFLDPTLYALDLEGFTTGIETERAPGYRISKDGAHIRISRDDHSPCHGSLQLFNISGILVTEIDLDGRFGVSIPMPGEAGLYLLSIRNGTTTQTKKVTFP